MKSTIPFPRFFKHTSGFESNALYVRHDSQRKCVVITKTGDERKPHFPWTLLDSLLMVDMGRAAEITKDEAERLL